MISHKASQYLVYRFAYNCSVIISNFTMIWYVVWNAKCDKNNVNNSIIKGKNKNRLFLKKSIFTIEKSIFRNRVSKFDFYRSNFKNRFGKLEFQKSIC